MKKNFILTNVFLRLHVFAGNGAGDGGFMHADGLGHLHHGQGFQVGDALFHEFPLALHDFVADVQNRLLTLVEALDEKFSGADFFRGM